MHFGVDFYKQFTTLSPSDKVNVLLSSFYVLVRYENQFADYLKSIHYFTCKAGSVGSQLKYLVYIDWFWLCPECFIFSETQEGHSFS